MKFDLRCTTALCASALSLQACVYVPQGHGNMPAGWYIPNDFPGAVGGTAPQRPAAAAPAAPVALNARLYPENDKATEVGMVAGTVTNMMDGKGRFQLQYRGELLAGEATAVPGSQGKGLANAYGPSGAYMSCDYQMRSPARGVGTCSFSDGALYQVHIGN